MNKVNLDKLIKYASSKELRHKEYITFKKMEPSINMPVEAFKIIAELDETDYTSVRTIIGAFVQLAKPKSYLEIGTRRGHSLCMAVNCSSEPLNLFSFDIWIENYAGEANPGPEFIKKELDNFAFIGNIAFMNGDSKKTIPEFFQNTSNTQEIDLIFVDGDHSEEGAKTDLLNVVDHIALGGLLVFDDIIHPDHLYLYKVWNDVLANRKNFELRESTKYPYGWAIALRLY